PRTKDWINRAYFDAAIEAEVIPATSTMTLTAGAGSYTLPAAVGRIKQMVVKPAGSSQFNPPMERTSYDLIVQRRRYGNDQAVAGAQPSEYDLIGTNDLEVWPTPAAADVIMIEYWAYPIALSGNTDVPVFEEPYASNLLEFGALVHAGDFKGDPSTS